MIRQERNNELTLLHPVNIYVYKNGQSGVQPTLVHISSDMKRTMESVLEAVKDRLKFDVGYPQTLYYLNGLRVCKTIDLQMYEEYVVVTNLDSRFRCVEYGRPKSPLLIAARDSKHVKTICVNDESFNMYNINRRKKEDKKFKYGFLHKFDKDGFGPSEMAYMTNRCQRTCGTLCKNIKRGCECPPPCKPPLEICPTHCCCPCSPAPPPPCTACTPADQYPCPEHLNRDSEEFYSKYEKECGQANQGTEMNMSQDMSVSTTDLQKIVDEYPGLSADREHLMAFINRYRDIGGQLYKMFNDRLTEDDCGNSQDSHNVEMDNPLCHKEDLFERFQRKLDEMEKYGSSGKRCSVSGARRASQRTGGSTSRSPGSISQSPGSVSRQSGNRLSNTMDNSGTEARTSIGNSGQTTNNQYQPQYQPQYPGVDQQGTISLSALPNNSGQNQPMGSMQPQNNTYPPNNLQVYHAIIKQDKHMSEINVPRKEKDLDETLSKYKTFLKELKLKSKRDSAECDASISRGLIKLSEKNSGNNNTTPWRDELLTTPTYVRFSDDPTYDLGALDELDAASHISPDEMEVKPHTSKTEREHRRPRQKSPVGHDPLPDFCDEVAFDSLDEFERLYHNSDYRGQPPRTRRQKQRERRNNQHSHESEAIPIRNRNRTTFESDEDEFHILHHQQIHAKPERPRLPLPQFRNDRLLVPTYDTNGNFLHYVFK